jgi:hypothetical protein
MVDSFIIQFILDFFFQSKLDFSQSFPTQLESYNSYECVQYT